ncbi:HPP family transmembrane protein [Skeletonema marinoi]|uniref:HPP family transmembrane protein n=1 Tax=Skeletonema marinoi TaxID=267567 RepID=A0AAD8Y638_9STRA|nr:HPP family transmembrane protein [Skeletonema marinoi]
MMPPNALDVKQHRRSLFIKRIPQEADYNSPNYNPSARDAFERLTVTTRLDYCSKNATDPGVGVAGALWSESNNSSVLSTGALAVVQSGVQTLSDKISDKLHLHISDPLNRSIRGMVLGQDNEQVSNRVLWRDINSLAEDPDQPYDERLQLFAKAGFALAAGISFNIRGFKGIVVFFANPHADMKKLSDNTNSKLIEFAAQFIGSAVAVRVPLQNAKLLQTRRPISNWKILRVKILAVIKFQRPIHVKNRGRSRSWGSPSLRRSDSFHMLRRAASVALINREESFKILSEATARLKSDVKKSVVDIQHQSKVKTIKWWQKVQGGHASIPPSFNNTQCLWTFTGVLSTHVVLSRLACFLARGGQYRLVIGPLGALTTLQYNLTAAPASQPRNAFFAQGIALCTCYLLHKFPGLDVYHRCTLAPTIVATLTARLGLIHPPAGATSVVFSIENYGIEEMILFLVGNLIAIVFAVTINNMSEKRQYPTTKWI